MQDLPFAIPESLATYLVQFESAPEKTIRRLKKQLSKRGPDPVAYFLLGWFFHQREENDKALDCALKAKTFAPGSPFFNKVHYYFSHPELFDAWQSQSDKRSQPKKSIAASGADPITDLNKLIERLSAMESKRINKNEASGSKTGNHDTTDYDDVDNIVSETLAKIHEQQGKIEAAINTYGKLKKRRQGKREYYDGEIERLKKIQKDKDSS